MPTQPRAQSNELSGKQLGVYLVEAGLITPTQVKMALEDQKIHRKRLGEILVDRGWVEKTTIEYLIEKVVLPERQAVEEQLSHPRTYRNQDLAPFEPDNQAEGEGTDLTLRSPIRRVVRFLFLAISFLVLACVAGQFCKYFLGYDQLFGLIPLFDVKRERSIATWYSSSTLLFCSLLLGTIATAKKIKGGQYIFHWRILAFIFLFLSIDETASIHEMANSLRYLLKVNDFLFYAWIIPYAIFVLIFVLAYLKFIAALSPKTRLLFLLAGSVYIAGAIGMELLEARYASVYGESMLYNSISNPGMIYAMMTIVEEFLEMLGVLIFIYALLSYISSYVKGGLRIQIIDYRKWRRSA